MHLLFSLGQRSALQSLQYFILPSVVRFLDDFYVNFQQGKPRSYPARWVWVHQEKTKVWKRAGLEPEACSSQEAAERVDPTQQCGG